MTQRWVYAALAFLFLGTPATAVAQAYERGALPPQEILGLARDGGFDPLGQPLRRGPNYVLRAVDDSDREVRVVIDARSGDILSVTPVTTASRIPPGGSMGPYERMAPGYVPPAGYRGGPPVVLEDDEPAYGRPSVPAAPPVRSGAQPSSRGTAPPSAYSSRTPAPSPEADDDDAPDSRPLRSTEIPPADRQDGLLPPPPERFPQRAAPSTPPKPKPVKRAAATPPKSAPLPKPRPPVNSDTPPAPPVHSTPLPPPAGEAPGAEEPPH